MTTKTTLDAAIAAIAETQLGLVTRCQLIELGASPDAVDRWVMAGRLAVTHPGVYRIGGAPTSLDHTLMAACLATGGMVSHRSAAWLGGFGSNFAGVREVSVPLIGRSRAHGVRVHRSTDLDDTVRTTIRGIPATEPHRTLLDLGAVVSQRILDRALDEALAIEVATYEGLLDVLDRYARRGRRGVAKLRTSLAGRSEVPQTVLEAAFERLLRTTDLDLPPFIPQFEIRDADGTFVARADFGQPDLRLLIELDGAKSRVGRNALQWDVNRQNAVLKRRYLVVRYTWADVVGRPDRTMRDLNEHVRLRRAELCHLDRA